MIFNSVHDLDVLGKSLFTLTCPQVVEASGQVTDIQGGFALPAVVVIIAVENRIDYRLQRDHRGLFDPFIPTGSSQKMGLRRVCAVHVNAHGSLPGQGRRVPHFQATRPGGGALTEKLTAEDPTEVMFLA